ncbi:MAG: thiamine pyrophosphate-dependent dehydrogenase E1 component subunit alpha [Actinobacteria bacterium]|nr:thiamine pyrophosphate-dependent dehydrogenase E1 component subunit alpha [Actinomycetota bacterium]
MSSTTPLADNDIALELYREMVRGRAIEAEIIGLCESRVFSGFYHPGEGQEAVPAAVGVALQRDDCIFYAHRGVTYLTAKGMSPVSILGDFAGTVAGSTRGLGAGIVHCIDQANGVMGQGGTLGSCFPLAMGAALAMQLRNVPQVSVAFFGDGTAARGTFLEAAVMAVARKLPVVFVCENNGYAVSARIDVSQGVGSLVARAQGMGLRTWSVDGYDAIAVHAAASDAIEHSRSGQGPTFVEAVTERRTGHFVGDLQPYRQRVALEDRRDPIDEMRERLVSAGIDADRIDQIGRDAALEMRAALDEANRHPRPGPERILEGVWA